MNHSGAYSDRDIMLALKVNGPRLIEIDPIDIGKQLQPASVDLTLGPEILHWPDDPQVIDLADRKNRMISELIPKDHYYPLEPGGFVLGSTVERVKLGSKIVGKVEGKSSMGRLGLTAHVTAGFIDPGFNGLITLELFNASPNTILLRPGVPICQIAFFECVTESNRPYGSEGLGSRYQNQQGVQAAKK